jgi:tripartite ATP-independent transporter DctM subunit
MGMLVVGIPIGIAFPLLVIAKSDAWGIDWSVLPSTTFDAISAFPLLAIPLFILGGEVMNRGGLIRQLSAVCDRLFGWARAPMGHVMIAASALMGAITGSSVATVAAIGGTVGPEMVRRGYAPGYTAALNASAGLLGVLIPPSIPLILYGSIVGVSITQLFLAAMLPGLVMMLAFMLVHTCLRRKVLASGRELQMAGSAPVARAGESMARVLWRAMPAMLLPVVVLGGIYSGVFTPTEAAAVAALYALAMTILARTLRFAELKGVFHRAALSSAAILVVIGFTSVFNRAMVLQQVPQDIAAFAAGATDSAIVFLLVVNLVLLVIGMFMETNAATLLMGPLLAPAAARFGIDPVHFGIILVTNIEIGLLTPPLAANLYVAARTNNVPVMSLLRYLGWFLGACLVVMALITFVPALPLWYRMF